MEEAIAADREEHPGCSYSQSSQSSYQRRGSETTMETIERVHRQCRGEQPVEIYRNTSQSSGDADEAFPQRSDDNRWGSIGGMVGPGNGTGRGRLELEHGGSLIDGIFRDFFGMVPGSSRPHPYGHYQDQQQRRARPHVPPHRSNPDPMDPSDAKERRKQQRFRKYDHHAEEV